MLFFWKPIDRNSVLIASLAYAQLFIDLHTFIWMTQNMFIRISICLYSNHDIQSPWIRHSFLWFTNLPHWTAELPMSENHLAIWFHISKCPVLLVHEFTWGVYSAERFNNLVKQFNGHLSSFEHREAGSVEKAWWQLANSFTLQIVHASAEETPVNLPVYKSLLSRSPQQRGTKHI